MPDWNKLHKELDDALDSMSNEMFRGFYIKSKADSLTERFYYTLPNNGSFSGTNNVNERWNQARQCAIVCVKEMIDEIECIQEYNELLVDYTEFWRDLLTELNTLNETE
jgi:hypothetical protein